MPSSMIFACLVVIWLLILVPAVARHRQEVARPSVAALSGRVLERPRRRPNLEVNVMDDVQQSRPDATRTDREDDPVRVPAARQDGADRFTAGEESAGEEPDEYAGELDSADHRRERPPPRYRPGRGGYDAEAAALAADARYAFRQRVVLAMLVVALVTGVLAAVTFPWLWWPHAAVDLALVGYLVYLRRQVRMEEAIRQRRAARIVGTRRPTADEDPDLDEWVGRGGAEAIRDDEPVEARDESAAIDDPARPDDLDREEPERVTGIGEPLSEFAAADAETALPRRQPVPPPPLPPGTVLVVADDQDPDLHELDEPTRPDYRRAAGR